MDVRVTQIGKPWCVLGNFNAIRTREKRKGVGNQVVYAYEIRRFNAFIKQVGLFDLRENLRGINRMEL